MTTLTIVIPCFNEKESLSDLINNLKILNNKIKFLIIENGSSDGSYEYLNEIKEELPSNIVIYFKKENTGYGSGVFEGLNKIQNSKYIGWIHGDLQFEFTKLNQTYVELKNIEGRSHKEIADYLDISVTAAKVRLHRAHQKLRQILEEVER